MKEKLILFIFKSSEEINEDNLQLFKNTVFKNHVRNVEMLNNRS